MEGGSSRTAEQPHYVGQTEEQHSETCVITGDKRRPAFISYSSYVYWSIRLVKIAKNHV